MSKKYKGPAPTKDVGKDQKKKFPMKLGAVALVAMLALFMMAGAASAFEFGSLAHQSLCYDTKYLTLFSKNPSTWQIIDNGVNGEMIYCDNNYYPQFQYRAYNMQPNIEYALVRVPVIWDGSVKILDLDKSSSTGYVAGSGVLSAGGAKVWLVPLRDLTSRYNSYNPRFKVWNPTQYLFENNLI